MDQKPDIDIQLLQAWLDGECTPEEKRTVEQWLAGSPRRIEVVEHLVRPRSNALAGFDRNRVKAKILRDIDTSGEGHALKTVSRPSAGPVWWLRAAAAVLVIVTAGMLSWMHHTTQSAETVVFRETTSPARTITTFTLPDGTRVELNANSRLRYPVSFSEDRREVFLEGEAFFSVQSEAERPFKVQSGGLTTTVLGTEFNVNYMPDLGRVDVALVEGRVSVEASGPDADASFAPVVLEPDQWVSYSESVKALSVQDGIRGKLLWREGILEFEGKTLREVAAILENWYGVEVTIEDPSAAGMQVTGTFKDESLEHVLETLGFVAGIEYKLEKNETDEIDKVLLSSDF